MESLNKHRIDRLLYFGNYDILKTNGPGVNEIEFTRALCKWYGKDLWCVLPSLSKGAPHLEQANTFFYRRPHYLNPFLILLNSIWLTFKIAWLIRRNRIDLMVVRFWYMPLAPCLLALIFRIPIVIKTAGPRDPALRRRHILSRIYWGLGDQLDTFVFRQGIGIDVVSEAFKDRLLPIAEPPKIAVIPNAANTDSFRPMDDEAIKKELEISGKWPVLGYVGGSPSVRGARQLLETARRLLPDFPDLHILIVGWDTLLDQEKEDAQRLGIASHVSFLGQQPYAKIPEIMNAIDIGFSFGPVHARVIFSAQKVMQYIACGIPLISIPGEHEFIAENDLGSLAEAHDFDAIAEATRTWANRLKNDDGKIRRHIRNYALENLSVDQALQTRLDFWADRLASRGNLKA